MKKFGLVLLMLLAGAVPAYAASWGTDFETAIRNNDFDSINMFAARNPAEQGGMAMFLLRRAAQDLSASPLVAAKIFEAASPFIAQVSANQSAEAGSIIQLFLTTVSTPEFQTANQKAASMILSAALQMSAQPNILAAMPGLHDSVAAGASDYLERNPQDVSKLRQLVSLAQFPTAPPQIGLRGAIQPSAH